MRRRKFNLSHIILCAIFLNKKESENFLLLFNSESACAEFPFLAYEPFGYFCAMQMTALQWCELLGGTLEGNPNSIITHPSKIEDAGEGAISFIGNAKYVEFAYTTKASALIVSNDEEFEKEVQ